MTTTEHEATRQATDAATEELATILYNQVQFARPALAPFAEATPAVRQVYLDRARINMTAARLALQEMHTND